MTPRSIDWIAIEGLYRAGVRSVRSIAEEHGITDMAIHKRAKKFGWSRDPEGTKRQIVKARLAGMQPGMQFGTQTINESASQDVQDMELGLQGARKALQATVDRLDNPPEDPKDLKILSECIRINVETIRAIRGLNEPMAAHSAPSPKEERDALTALP